MNYFHTDKVEADGVRFLQKYETPRGEILVRGYVKEGDVVS